MTLLLILAANAALLIGGAPGFVSPLLGAVGALLLAFLLPGWGLATLLTGVPHSGEQWLRSILFGLATGFGIVAVATLLLAYRPGGIERWMLMVTYNLLALLAVAAILQRKQQTVSAQPTDAPNHQDTKIPTTFWGLLALFLILAAVLRFTWLGFSEFQGDEARVMLRAQELLDGFENPIYIHHKMPGEILFAATFYGLVGSTSEAAARLPFAIASLAGVAAILLLGWRIFGPITGIVAAALLAVDGFAIAFGRIVQYQSVVILAGILILLILWEQREAQDWRSMLRWFLLAGLIATGALYAHYDILAIGLPALWLLWQVGRRQGWKRLTIAVAPALMVVVGATSLFLIWWVANSGFEMALSYLVNERLGMAPPYNNLGDFLHRAVTYSSSYYVIFLGALVLVGVAIASVRALGRVWGGLFTGALVASAVVALLATPTVRITASVLPVAILLLAVPLLPHMSAVERMLWLWWSPLVVVSLFLIATPDSHVYIFYVPWVLVAGWVCQELYQRAPALQAAPRPALIGGLAALLFIFWLWPWLVFADAPAQRFRLWESERPAAYWYPFGEITARANMGFPLRVGWKTVGVLMAADELTGGFETNARREVVDWYTRGSGACPAPVTNYFAAPSIEQSDADFAEFLDARSRLAAMGGTIWVMDGETGLPGLRVLATEATSIVSGEFAEDKHASDFIPLTAEEPVARRGKVTTLPEHVPVSARLGDAVTLIGYRVDWGTLHPGETLRLDLIWSTDDLLYDSWTVFVQLVDPTTNAKAGQTDALPVCGQNETPSWRPGDLIIDPQQVTIFDDAAPGAYNVYAGMYSVISGARLPITLSDGSSSGDWISLGQVVVE